jgi:hypothetical protein
LTPQALAARVCIAVLAANSGVPSLHLHTHDGSEHVRVNHRGSPAADHDHGHGAALFQRPIPATAELSARSDAGGDPVYLTGLPTDLRSRPVLPALPARLSGVQVAYVPQGSVVLPTPRSHDPPLRSTLGPRSPPLVSSSFGA